MPGRRQKNPAALANTRGGRGRGLEVVARDERIAPRPPAGIGAYARKVWREYWGTWVADAVNYEAHGERLRHWIKCVDEREKLTAIVQAEPLVEGSQGQPVRNPLRYDIKDLNREIEKAEEAFGMTPLATWRMQLTSTEAQRSAHDLRRELMKPVREEQLAEVIDLDELE